MVEYRYSYQNLCTPPEISGGLLPTVPLCPKSLMNFPLSKMPPANGIFYSVSSAFYFRTCIPYFCYASCCIASLNIPMGGIYTSIICKNPETLTGHTLLVLCQIKLHHDNLIESEKYVKVYALKKWESTLNLPVRAHGYYVELIVRSSCKGNYPLDINSSAPMILHSTFEYYLLVPRGYHTFALHLMSVN